MHLDTINKFQRKPFFLNAGAASYKAQFAIPIYESAALPNNCPRLLVNTQDKKSLHPKTVRIFVVQLYQI